MQETTRSYPVDENFDPLSEDYLEDPYAYYARFRRESPVFFAPKIRMWVVSRYEDILAIVKDPRPSRTQKCKSLFRSWSRKRRSV
jgi:cytochrome P450